MLIYAAACRLATLTLATIVTCACHAPQENARHAPQENTRHVPQENTLAIFTSDHGASFLGKGHVYEAGVRVPLMLRWPRLLPTPRRLSAAVALLDVLPTLLDAAALDATSVPLNASLSALALNSHRAPWRGLLSQLVVHR